MKNFNILILFLLLQIRLGIAQTAPPQGISYQAVIIDKDGIQAPGMDIGDQYLSNESLEIRFSVVPDVNSSSIEYQETQTTNTDDYGLIQLVIGQGKPTISSFSNILWEDEPKWLKVEIRLSSETSFKAYSIDRLWSVPYALYSKESGIADSVRNSTIKNQLLSLNGDTLYISDGNWVKLPDFGSSSSGEDSTNELQQLILQGDSLFISNGNAVLIQHPIDPDIDTTNELQTLFRASDSIGITKGNMVDIRDNDSDTINEIQDLYLLNDTLRITKSSKGISLSNLKSNTNGSNGSGINSSAGRTIFRTCYSAIEYVNVDSIIGDTTKDIRYSLASAFKDFYFISSDASDGRSFLIHGNQVLNKIFRVTKLYDMTHTDDGFVGVVLGGNGNDRIGGQSISLKTYIFKCDTNGNYEWHTSIPSNYSWGYFVKPYYVYVTTSNLVSVDLTTGSQNSITRTNSTNSALPSGFCMDNKLYSYKNGAQIGTCKYPSISSIEGVVNSNIGIGFKKVTPTTGEPFPGTNGNNHLGVFAYDDKGELSEVGDGIWGDPSYMTSNERSMKINDQDVVFTKMSAGTVIWTNHFSAFGYNYQGGRPVEIALTTDKSGEVNFIAEIWMGHDWAGMDLDEQNTFLGIDTNDWGSCVNDNEVKSQLIILRLPLK